MSTRSTRTQPTEVVDCCTIPLTVTLPVCETRVPVTGGVCMPRGALLDAKFGALSTEGRDYAAQFDVVNRWSDGSIRWVTVSTVMDGATGDAFRSVDATLRVDDELPDEDGRLIRVRHHGAAILISLVWTGHGQPCERSLRLTPELIDDFGNEIELEYESVHEEISGPVRLVTVVSGRAVKAPFLTIQMRLTIWVQEGLIQAELRIRNSRRARHSGGLWDLGDSGSFLIESLCLQVEDDSAEQPSSTFWKAGKEQPTRICAAEQNLRITQFGSGGRNWNSTNHRLRDGRSGAMSRGFVAESATGTLRGLRAEPVVGCASNAGSIAVAVPEFWQQFPGSIAARNGVVSCGLFPVTDFEHELQGGEQKTRSIWISVRGNHDSTDALDWVFDPPRLTQPTDWYWCANVFPWFPGMLPAGSVESAVPNREPTHRLAGYLAEATTAGNSFEARREAIDEYGWRNYGDIHADHEQTHYAGSNTVVSHYNNQFDLVLGGILNMAATGDVSWFQFFEPMARHVSDIDIYHTADDRAVWNGGLFWHTDHYVDARTATHRTYSRHNQCDGQPYGGGPCNEHNYTTGLLYCHFLTGHPEFREAVLSLAEWVIQMDDGRQTVFGLLDDGPTGYASHTVFGDYHGPGRGAGNSLNAMVDAWILTGSNRYLAKAEELIRRCVNPNEDIDALHLLDAEGHWSYTVFLTALGRYLLVRDEADQRDAMYAYARAALSHYGRWMLAHEHPSLSHPEELEFPTEAWAAQDFRKANALRIAAACEDDVVVAAAMREKADELNDAAWRDLYSFGRQHLTARCLSILMTEGQRDLFHRLMPEFRIPPADCEVLPLNWQSFVPQKDRVKQMLRSPQGIAVGVTRALNPGRCWRAIKSWMRYQ